MFTASPLEFRLRYYLHGLIYVLGFTASWNYVLHLDPSGPNAHVWGILADNLFQAHWMNIDAAFNVLLSVAILCALAGAALRTWGAAYLGSNVVQDGAMHTAAEHAGAAGLGKTDAGQGGAGTGGILTAGPFRFLRNPLYLGTFLHTLALALLMPRTGAIFTILAIAILQVRLVMGEENFLSARLGASYAAYTATVPRMLPTLRPKAVSSGERGRWGQAVLGEIYMWGVAGSFLFLGWRYNAVLLIQCVVVSLGVSLVARAVAPREAGVRTVAVG